MLFFCQPTPVKPLEMTLQLCFPHQGLCSSHELRRALTLLQWDNGGFPWWLATSKVCKHVMAHMTRLAGTVVFTLHDTLHVQNDACIGLCCSESLHLHRVALIMIRWVHCCLIAAREDNRYGDMT